MLANLRRARAAAPLLLLVAIGCEPRVQTVIVPEGAVWAGAPAVVAAPPVAGTLAPPIASTVTPPPIAGALAPPITAPAQPENFAVAPDRLSGTGLFADPAAQTLGPGVEPYQPMYELWSDNADKRRWVRLPPDAPIDTADMDVWSLPIGTKIWKEFGRDGRALETRYMAKYGPNATDWVYASYQWDASSTEGFAVPDGVPNAAGTTHDIPSTATCVLCHNGRPSAALGFSAIQLSHAGPGLTLDALSATGRLTVPPSAPLRVPGDPVTERALGYLHANCGGCHNESSAAAFGANGKVIFWQAASRLGSVEQTTTYVNMVLNTNGDLTSLRSGLDRMRSRPLRQMPPLATEIVDELGVAIVDAWLQQLSAQFPPRP